MHCASMLLAGLIVVAPDQPAKLHVGPYLQRLGPESVTVMWETTRPTVGTVHLGPLDKPGLRRTERQPATIHEIRIDGLQPDTAYTYRITWEGTTAGPFPFRTAPPNGAFRSSDPASRIRIAAYGDSRSRPEIHRSIVEVMAPWQPDIILHCGDLVAQGAFYEQWKPQFFDPLADLLPKTALFTILGNHEQNSEHYYNFFSLPGNEAWWSADFGPLHFIGLDSCRLTEADSEQTRWLEQDLQTTTDEQWVVVFLHHPLFSAHPTRSVNQNRWSWQPLFQKYGVDLVLAGHDHHYHRSYPVGPLGVGRGRAVQHFTTGGGGASLYPVHRYPWTAKAAREHNVAVIDVYRDRVHGQVFRPSGEPIDAFVIHRDATVEADQFVAYDVLLWQRRLEQFFARQQPRSVGDEPFEVAYRWRLPSDFPQDVRVHAQWVGAPGWKHEGAGVDQLLKPGDDVALQGRLSSQWPACLPATTLQFTLSDPQGHRLFRNDQFAVTPVRVWPRRVAVTAAAPDALKIDGMSQDWSGVKESGHFADSRGDRLAQQQTAVRVAADEQNLYVLARMDWEANLGAAGEAQDDALNILRRDESFHVRLATQRRVYTFAVNTSAARYDARDTDRTYNAPFRAAVHLSDRAWHAELAIPLASLQGKPERINFGRTSNRGRVRSEWVPSFGDPDDKKWFGYLQGQAASR